ncbi:MAG: zinc finger Ran-binding domain-containing protein [Clostridia bacterium]|nr:zinc finger Ran-binding domain-containing protein [Clostridia bacterium]
MICKKCSTDNPPENKVCVNCGSVLSAQDTLTKKRRHLFRKFGGLIAVFAVCLIMFVFNIGTFNPKYEMPIDRSQHPIVYVKNNALGVKPVSKPSSVLSDYLIANESSGQQPKVSLSKNGEGLYFLEGYDDVTRTGSLFASYNGKTKIPISSRAYGNMQVSANGKYVLFMESPILDKNWGTLYIYTKNGKKEKIADNVCLNEFGFSEDNKNIAYIEFSDSSGKGDLYYQKINGSREKIDADVSKIIHISSFSSVLYLKSNTSGNYDLHYWKRGGTSKEISKNVPENMVYTSSLSDNLFFCSDNTSSSSCTLYSSTKSKVANVVDTAVLTPLYWDANYQNIIYTKNFSVSDFTSDTYLKLKGQNAVKILSATDNSHTSVSCTYDFKTIAYIGDIKNGLGNLYIRKFGLFANNEPEMIAQNVSNFEFSKTGKTLVYTASPNGDANKNLYLYSNKKTTLIAENIQDKNYRLTADAKAVFYIANYNGAKDSGNLFYKNVLKPNSGSIKIDSDVARLFYPRSSNQVIYTKNYSTETGESELYLWKNKKAKLIDSGIIRVLFEEI